LFSLLLADGSRCLFVAEATPAGVIVLRLLTAVASIATIFDYLNIRPAWANQPNYNNAGGCRENCQAQEAEMRQRSINVFSAVHRASENHDVAVMAGRHSQSPHTGEVAIQYSGVEAINLRDREIEILGTAAEYLGKHTRLVPRKLAKAIAVTGKRGDVTVTHTETGKILPAQMMETALVHSHDKIFC